MSQTRCRCSQAVISYSITRAWSLRGSEATESKPHTHTAAGTSNPDPKSRKQLKQRTRTFLKEAFSHVLDFTPISTPGIFARYSPLLAEASRPTARDPRRSGASLALALAFTFALALAFGGKPGSGRVADMGSSLMGKQPSRRPVSRLWCRRLRLLLGLHLGLGLQPPYPSPLPFEQELSNYLTQRSRRKPKKIPWSRNSLDSVRLRFWLWCWGRWRLRLLLASCSQVGGLGLRV